VTRSSSLEVRDLLASLDLADVSVTIEIITPETAAEWLELNGLNRPVAQLVVTRIARDMSKGEYILTGESIIFGESGRLLDGQHRLWAIVESGVAIQSVVVRGIPNEERAIQFVDSGRSRTLQHAMHVTGTEGASKDLAAAANMAWRYEHHRFKQTDWPSRSEALTWIEDNGGIREAVTLAKSVYVNLRIPRTPVAVALYLNSRVDPEAAAEFWRLASTGEGLTAKDPILTYRRWAILTMAKRTNEHPQTWLLYNLKAMNQWRDGKQVGILAVKNGEMPEPWSDR